MTYKKILIICTFFLITATGLAQDFASGKKLIVNEKYSQAIEYFKTQLNGKTKDDADFYLGQVYFQLGKLDSAKYFYSEGIKADPENPLNYAGMAKVNIAEKNTAEAGKNEEQAVELGDEENPDVYITLAEGYVFNKNGSTDKAIELLNKAIKIKPKYTPIYVALGKVYMSKSNGTEAIKNFQQAISIESGNAEALTQKAKVYILINNHSEAITLLNEAVASDPDYSPAYLELAELNYTMKDYAKAAEYYTKYMETSGVNLDKQKRFGQLLYMDKEYQKAIDVLKNVVAADPDNSTAYRIIAYSYLRMEDFPNSMENFQKLFEIKDVDIQVADYDSYVDLLTRADNDSLAIEYLYKIAELDSSRKDVYNQMVPLFYKSKNWQGIIDALNRKGDLTAQELFDLGKAYQFVKDTVMADTTFGRLIAAKPDLSLGYIWKARIKSTMDPESTAGLAKPFYEKVVELSSADTVKYKNDLIEAYSYLGYYHYIKENFQESFDYYTKLLALEPTNDPAQKAIAELRKRI
jgi:tetratricopeptide (TPR) repeat protein